MTIFKFNLNQENETVAVKPFASKKAAGAEGNSGMLIAGPEDITSHEELTGPILVSLFNSIATTPVAKFSDRTTAARRVFEALMVHFGEQAAPEALEARPAVPGATAPAKAKKASKRAPAKAAAPKTKKGTRRTKVLVLKAGFNNPYRPKTKSWDAFEAVAANPGLTFNELIGKGAPANLISSFLRLGFVSVEKKAEIKA